jgi:CheY-like chemotaxis protein
MSPRNRLLIVDDEPDILTAMTEFLREVLPGWDIVQATSGEDAIGKLDAQPTLILSDYLMPGINGLELSRQLRARGVTAPIILMTAFVDSSFEERVTASGVVDRLFRKPLDADGLVEAILGHA